MRRIQETATETDRREGGKTIRRDKELSHMRRSEELATEPDREEDGKRKKIRIHKG